MPCSRSGWLPRGLVPALFAADTTDGSARREPRGLVSIMLTTAASGESHCVGHACLLFCSHRRIVDCLLDAMCNESHGVYRVRVENPGESLCTKGMGCVYASVVYCHLDSPGSGLSLWNGVGVKEPGGSRPWEQASPDSWRTIKTFRHYERYRQYVGVLRG